MSALDVWTRLRGALAEATAHGEEMFKLAHQHPSPPLPAPEPMGSGSASAPPLASVAPVVAPPPPPPAPAPAPAAVDHPGFASEGAFYDWLRHNGMLGPTISGDEFKGCDAITRACAAARWPVSYTAYALATAYLETAHTMEPVKEANWLKPSAAAAYFFRMYDIGGQRPAKARELGNVHPGDGAAFCGRGYPQMTGRTNYERANAAIKAAGILDVDLIATPELALRPDVAAVVMIDGMGKGWFTGRKLADFLPPKGPGSSAQFFQCRTIINGHDRASDVATFAADFQSALAAGGWRF